MLPQVVLSGSFTHSLYDLLSTGLRRNYECEADEFHSYSVCNYGHMIMPLQILGLSKAEIIKRVDSALERVALSDKTDLYPGDLSTGQQQRVGIARAIVHRPALLLADEPTGNLDPRLAAEIMGVFEDINRLGTSVLIASHDLTLIARMRHRMLTLQRGRLIGDGEAGV